MAMKCVFFLLMASSLLLFPALGQEVVDLYSDLQSCDVTVAGTGAGDLLKLELFSSGKVLQSRTLALDGPGTWVARWDKMPSTEGSYSARATLFRNGSLLSEKSIDFHHGGRVPVKFDVRDYQADSSGVHLLIYSPDLAIVDIYHMLIKDGKALYVARESPVSISDGIRNIDFDWKQLLVRGEQYSGRVKIVEKETGQTRAFMSSFLAREDARITDTYEDETGASATILGKSMTPFHGFLRFLLSQDERSLATLEKKTPVLLKGDDETIEVSWNKTLNPGIYQLKIQLLGTEGDLIDFTERVIEAKARTNLTAVKTETPKDSSSSMILGLLGLVAFAGIIYVIRGRR